MTVSVMRCSDGGSDVCPADLLYRACRYGIVPATTGLLAERGYRLDSSIRSRYDYRHDGGPDFGAIGNDAFWRDAHRRVIELPLTTVFTGLGRRGGEGLYRTLGAIPRGRGVAARLGVLAREIGRAHV